MKGIKPTNLTAQLYHQAAGNPPGTLPNDAVSNSYPGLETDIRNLWRRILEGIELHEARNLVVSVDETRTELAPLTKDTCFLIEVEDIKVTVQVTGPKTVGGESVPLPDASESSRLPLEWSNALADIVHNYSGQYVRCKFRRSTSNDTIELQLKVQPVFEIGHAVISSTLVEPGELTRSLCSPWQYDYRECACFYWAASRPDYVNIEPQSDGTSAGHNWMQKDRTPSTPKGYIVDDRQDPRLITFDDLYQAWEQNLRFELGGKDTESK